MSKYEVSNNRFKKDGKRISREDVLKELNKEQFTTLLKNNKYSTRKSKESQVNLNVKINNPSSAMPFLSDAIETPFKSTKNTELTRINSKKENEYLKPSKKELKDAEKLKDSYRIEIYNYPKKGTTYELWRKNPRFGYYNFALYLKGNEEDDLIEGIIKDLRLQKEREAQKPKTDL